VNRGAPVAERRVRVDLLAREQELATGRVAVIGAVRALGEGF
jgi:hypothetical protein